jgi:hypothetical protein
MQQILVDSILINKNVIPQGQKVIEDDFNPLDNMSATMVRKIIKYYVVEDA